MQDKNGMQKKKHLVRQAGMTLIELLIVLGVAAGIIAGIFVASRAADSEQSAQQDAKEVLALVTNIQRIYKIAGYDTFTAAALEAAGGMPTGMRRNGAGFLTSNNINVLLTVPAAAPGTTFALIYGNSNGTQAQCQAVANALASVALVLNTGSVTNGVAGAAPTGGSVVKTTAGGGVDLAALIAGCSSANSARVAGQFN